MKRAVCLRYKEGDIAPVVVAKGKGYVAENIIEIAKKKDIPIYPDPDLSSILMNISPGDEIPKPLYKACAEVIAFVLKLKTKP